MALTRPRLGQLNTSVVAQADPITVLNQGSSSANIDVGFLFNRANGLVSNVALYWSESAQSIVTAYTTNSGSTNANISVASYANLTVGNVLTANVYATGVYIGAGSAISGLFWSANNAAFSTGGGGGSAPAGATGQVQYNNGGALGATAMYYFTGNSAHVTTGNITTTGALTVAGGVGVGGNITASGNIYAVGTNSKHGYTWANSVSSAYTVFNSSTNSVDLIFG